ncbi:hypothetical protein DERF_012121 [Dermatophagoides farinae]|uniref:Uncharacterized protein n=1 Tax=Dermatophagoides farinae TaxID=6954 RepID=A0A922HRB9_DERFA|nr:hypothetical protein DERF_012121 [Dermatophagoides farinae]
MINIVAADDNANIADIVYGHTRLLATKRSSKPLNGFNKNGSAINGPIQCGTRNVVNALSIRNMTNNI